MLFLKSLRCSALSILWGILLVNSAAAQTGSGPLFLHPVLSPTGAPVAAYRDVKVQDFRKLVIGAFEDSRFSLTAVKMTTDGETHLKFSYPVPVGKGIRNVELLVRVNENLDKRKRCANCFLRLAELPDLPALQGLPWMAQYEVSSAIFPAIDRAFGKIRTNGQSAMDMNFKFEYRDQWRGERNLNENSFVGIDLPELKAAIVDSYRAAGFTFVNDDKKDLDAGRSELVFSFPIDPDQKAGVVYKVVLAAQFNDRDNRCYPCEIKEAYDPYQQLPPAGLSGMANRLSLESRFSAARTLAFERLKSAAGQHLRSGTVFLVPPKPAPLGSPRPQPVPVVVT